MNTVATWLMIMWTAGQNPAVLSQEFTSYETCQAAATKIAEQQAAGEDYRRFRMICTEK
uniref:Uncharacterized protein n=2 Tax=unclassified bacterial viruses TaxID=12333 RepID=A0AAU6VZN6_9VIRU